MNTYFKDLLQNISKKSSEDNEYTNKVDETNSYSEDEYSDNQVETNSTTDGTNDEDNVVHGGKSYQYIDIIYTYVPSVEKSFTSIPHLNLSKDLDRIIQSVHDSFSNEFMEPKSISQQIITKLNTFIISQADKYQLFILPITNTSKSFILTPFFTQLVKDTTHRYKLHIINPTFNVILEQINLNYLTTHHRLTLNQDLTYILNHYQSASSTESQAIDVSKDSIISSFKRISSAFTSQTDLDETVESFYSQLTNSQSHIVLKFIQTNSSANIITLSSLDQSVSINE